MKPDEYIREPFVWNNDETEKAQTSWIDAKYNKIPGANSYENQVSDPESIFNNYANLITLRKKYPVIETGKIIPVDCEKSILIYILDNNESCMLLIHNLNGEFIHLRNEDDQDYTFQLIYESDPACYYSMEEFIIAPYSTIVLQKLENDQAIG